MKKIKLGRLIILGLNLKYFENLAEEYYNSNLKKPMGRGIGLYKVLTTEKKFIDEIGLCPDISLEIANILKKIRETKKGETFLDLKKEDKRYFRECVFMWPDKLKSKANELNAFLLKKEHLLNLNMLNEGPQKFFNKSLWDKLPSLVKRDLDESCKCILFELPTSAGILALRATEAMLREYYKKKVKKTLPQKIKWNDIIIGLKKIGTNPTLTGHLDYLRENLRNKLNHPDSVLEQKEAENIFSMIINSIEEMAKEL